MTSQRQLEANRDNAKRSIGPKTQSGKARSSMNALKHGLTAKQIVIGDEDPQEFDALRARFERDFQDVDRELVERLVSYTWRLRRIPVFEAAYMQFFERLCASWKIHMGASRTKRKTRTGPLHGRWPPG